MRDVRRGAPASLGLVAAAVVAALAAGCFLDPYAELTDVRTDVRPAAADCAGCHVEIHREWAASAHAESWKRPAFVDATTDRATEACLGCHAPESIYVEGAPRVRATRREEGVTCIACHFDRGVLAGPAPAGALLEAHPIATERALYRQSDLCGKCHEGTFREWQAARPAAGEEKRTCQDCHMPKVVRKTTQATDTISAVLVSFEDEFEGRRHMFHLGALEGFAGAIAASIVDVRRGDGRVLCSLVLTNRLPHLLPTGDFGARPIAIDVEASDAHGGRLSTVRIELRKPLGTALVPGEPRRFPLGFPREATSLRVQVVRGGPAQPLVLHDEVVRLSLDGGAE